MKTSPSAMLSRASQLINGSCPCFGGIRVYIGNACDIINSQMV